MKKIIAFLAFLVVVISLLSFTSCSSKEVSLVIKYNDTENKTDTITLVENDELPKLGTVTNKWYKFLGWYANKNGKEFKVHDGNKYVVDNGVFKKKTYDIISNETIFEAKFELEDVNCFIELKTNTTAVPDENITAKYGQKMPELKK